MDGFAVRRDENDWVERVIDINVERRRSLGRTRKTWINVVREDMRLRWLVREDNGTRYQ